MARKTGATRAQGEKGAKGGPPAGAKGATGAAAKPAAKPKPRPQPKRSGVDPDPVAPRREVKLLRDVPAGELKSVEVAGAGRFLGAAVHMQGAAAGVSQVGLEIDGELVAIVRPDEAVRRGLTTPNATGILAVQNSYQSHWTVVLGWPFPVHVDSLVKLAVQVHEPIAELELSLATAW